MNDERLLVAPGVLTPGLLRLLWDAAPEMEVLLSAPGALPGGFDGAASLLRGPTTRLSRRTAFAYRQELLVELGRGIDRVPQTGVWRERIRAWTAGLREGRIHLRCLLDYPLFSRLLSRSESSVVPGGPVGATPEGRELDLELIGQAHRDARAWFAEHFGRAADISAEVLDVLDGSWAGSLVSPEDLYLKVLSLYFESTVGEMDREADPNPMLKHLTSFQAEAYQHAKGILRRYGGVYLADVVGLGKTFIALAILKHLATRYGQHAVVVAPPNVCPAWDELAAEFRVELITLSIGKLEDLAQYSDREVLVIDESHNFRNRGTLRHETVSRWLRPDGEPSRRKVILVSATPQNNRPADVKHQLEFFPDDHAPLPHRGESLDDYFRMVTRGRASLTELLQHLVVRRTRRFVNSAYPTTRLRRRLGPGQYREEPLAFPRRVCGEDQCLRYSIQGVYGEGLYDRILITLPGLHYPLHALGLYLAAGSVEDPRIANLRRAGRSIRGLYKVVLLKRLESSLPAFRLTLGRLRDRLAAAQADLAAGRVLVGVDSLSDPIGEDEVLFLPSGRRAVALPAELFDGEALAAHLKEDLAGTGALLREFAEGSVGADAKLRRLRSYLRERPPGPHRVLVFTQFADTAHYLGRSLGQEFGRTAVATGATKGLLDIARRFAPRANRADVPVAEQIELLISTDALSEGVNLQDADTLVNYDLHWNPVRLIQRAGRIDRLGSEHDEIHVASFLPEKDLEARLGLEAVLRRRIREFLDVFGEDSRVLPEEEIPDETRMTSAFTGDVLEEGGEEELDGLGRHLERLLTLRRHDPERYARIQTLRVGRRCLSGAAAPALVACRMGWLWRFYAGGESGLEELDDLAGLDILHRHARAALAADVEAADGSLDSLVAAATARFEPQAGTFRQKRARPRLSAAEVFVLRRLDEFAADLPEHEQMRLRDLRRWVVEGRAKSLLQKLGRLWRREKLPAVAVVEELWPLFALHSGTGEELGDPEVAGAVIGKRLPAGLRVEET